MFNKAIKKINKLTEDWMEHFDWFTLHIEDEINKIRSNQGQVNKELKDRLNILEDNQDLIKDISFRSIDNKLKIDYIQSEINKRIEYQRENMMLLMEHFGLYFDYEGNKKVIKKDKKK